MSADAGPHGLTTTIDGSDHLVGACCGACETHTFPAQSICPRCGATMSATPLPDRGTVWSWTVQRIRPKEPYVGPEDDDPFVVGYVDLGPVRVESRLEGKPADAWRIGDAVRLAPGAPDEDGNVWRFRFVSTEEVSS